MFRHSLGSFLFLREGQQCIDRLIWKAEENRVLQCLALLPCEYVDTFSDYFIQQCLSVWLVGIDEYHNPVAKPSKGKAALQAQVWRTATSVDVGAP